MIMLIRLETILCTECSDLKEIKHFLASNPQHWDGRSSMTGWDSLQLTSFPTVTIVQMEYKPSSVDIMNYFHLNSRPLIFGQSWLC